MALNSLSYKIVERNIGVSAREIDSSVNNKWVWDWLLEKDINDDYLSEYVKKVDQPGVAICSWCKDFLHYGSSGKKRLLKHAIQCKDKHDTNKKIFISNTTIPSSWIDPNSEVTHAQCKTRSGRVRLGLVQAVHAGQRILQKNT